MILLIKTEATSDFNILAGVPPVIRVNGELIYLNEPILTPHDCVHLAKQCLITGFMKFF